MDFSKISLKIFGQAPHQELVSPKATHLLVDLPKMPRLAIQASNLWYCLRLLLLAVFRLLAVLMWLGCRKYEHARFNLVFRNLPHLLFPGSMLRYFAFDSIPMRRGPGVQES